MEQYFEIWRDGHLAGIAVGIVQEEYPGIVAFDPRVEIREGDQLVPIEKLP